MLSVHLQCIRCKRYLGSLPTPQHNLVCLYCGSNYLLKDGVLDFVDIAKNGGQKKTLLSHKLSSFAEREGKRTDSEKRSRQLRWLHYRLGLEDKEATGLFLDIGCGYGQILREAAQEFELAVGIDLDLEELQSAAELNKQKGIQNAVLIRASAQVLPFMPNQFSAIYCVQVLEHVSDPEGVISGLRSVLVPDGYFFLSAPNRYTLRREPHTGLRWIGYLPHGLAGAYAKRMGKDGQYRSVHMISAADLSAWISREFGSSYEFVRSGFHQSRLARIAAWAWHVPVLSALSKWLVGDIEIIARRRS